MCIIISFVLLAFIFNQNASALLASLHIITGVSNKNYFRFSHAIDFLNHVYNFLVGFIDDFVIVWNISVLNPVKLKLKRFNLLQLFQFVFNQVQHLFYSMFVVSCANDKSFVQRVQVCEHLDCTFS